MDKVSTCHLDKTLRVIGGKWKLVILWHLGHGKLRFSELEKRIPTITQKMLAQSLRELERDKLITRKVFPVIPPKVEYTLTSHAIALEKVLSGLDHWGEKHLTRVGDRG